MLDTNSLEERLILLAEPGAVKQVQRCDRANTRLRRGICVGCVESSERTEFPVNCRVCSEDSTHPTFGNAMDLGAVQGTSLVFA